MDSIETHSQTSTKELTVLNQKNHNSTLRRFTMLSFKNIILLSLAFLLALSTIFAADYSDIEFPKVIFGDPQLAWKSNIIGAPLPSTCQSNYEDLDELGINILMTWFKPPAGGELAQVLYTTVNTPGIKVMGHLPSATTALPNTYTRRAWDSEAFRKRVYLEWDSVQGGSVWRKVENIEEYLWDFSGYLDDHHVWKGVENDDSGNNWPFKEYMKGIIWPNFLYDNTEPRGAYLLIKFRRDEAVYTPVIDPILQVRIWESEKHHPGTIPAGSYNNTFDFDYNEISTAQDFEWIDFHSLDINLKMREKYPDNTPAQLNLEVEFKRFCNVYVDSVAVYDTTGYNLGYYYPYGTGQSSYSDRVDLIETDLYNYYDLDISGLILDWYVGDSWELRLVNSIVIDSVMHEYSPSHRLVMNNPWGKNWYSPNGANLVNFADEYIKLSDFDGDKPYQLFTYWYPFDDDNSDLQAEIDTLIGRSGNEGRGLLYTQYTAEQNEVKPWWLIQCQYDEPPYDTHRNPTNEEILVQGYLSLAYGMKGIGYYLFYSDDSTPHDLIGIYEVDGGVWVEAEDANGVAKTIAIKQLNHDIDILAPCLNNLEWASGGCFDRNPPTLQHIDDISSASPVEACDFIVIDEDLIPLGYYFTVVNRDVNSSRSVIIYTDYTDEVNYFLEDMATHKIYRDDLGGNGYFDVNLNIPAGKGILFRAHNDYTWQGTVRVSGVLELENNLTILPGSIVQFYDKSGDGYDGGGLSIPNGAELYANGETNSRIVFEPEYHTKAEEEDGAPWLWINFDQGYELGSTKFQSCDFNNCKFAIKLTNAINPIVDWTFNDCNFNSCDDISITDYGIVAYGICDLNIHDCSFINCQRGIFLEDGDVLMDNCYFTSCSEYALYASNNASATIQNYCNFQNIGTNDDDRAINFNGNDIEVISSYFVNCSNGIFFNSSSDHTLTVSNTSFFQDELFDSKAIEIVGGNANISGMLQGFICTIEGYTEGIHCNNAGLVNITDITINDNLNNSESYGICADNSIIAATNLIFTGGLESNDIAIQCTDGSLYLENCDIETPFKGIEFTVGDQLTLLNSSITGADPIEDLSEGVYAQGGNTAIYGSGPRGYTVKNFDKGMHFSQTTGGYFNCGCIIEYNKHVGIFLESCGIFTIYDTYIRNNGYDDDALSCGLYCNASSPVLMNVFFHDNTGPGIFAANMSMPILGEAGNRLAYNEFHNNHPTNRWESQIYETNHSACRLNNCHNNIYLEDMEYFIYNTDQNQLRYVELNYWGAPDEPDPARFYPYDEHQPDRFYDYDPWDTTPNPGGGLGGMGGGSFSQSGLDAGLELEESEDYAGAVEEYQAFIQNNNDEVSKRTALTRVMCASIAGCLELEPLLDYYQTFIANGSVLTSNNSDTITSKLANHLMTKVKERIGDYNSAILDYEGILTNNLTLADSIYAIIDLGNAYLMMNAYGQSSASQLSINIPQMPELEPESVEEFNALKWELLNLLYNGNSISSQDGTGGIILIPDCYALHQNYPNPFNPETTINYDLPELSNVRLDVFNVLGQRVYTLVDGLQSTGFKSVVWNGKSDYGAPVSSGIYIYRITAEGRMSGEKFIRSLKMLLLQ